MQGLADAERPDWLRTLFGFAALGHGSADAREAARTWSKTSARYRSDADFDRDWNSFLPKAGGISAGTLLDAAEKAGLDLEPWRNLANASLPTTVVTPPIVASRAPGATFFSSVKFDAPNLRPVSWLLPGLMLRGEITVIAGQGGGAKTALAVLMAGALAAGRSTIGPFAVHNRPGGLRVGFLSAEEDCNRLALLVAATCGVLAFDAAERALVATNLFVHDAQESGWKLGQPRPGQREEIAPAENDLALSALSAVLAGVDVLIMDNLAALFALPNENDNNLVTNLMRRLTAVTRQADCAVLLLHHTPKMTREAAAQNRGEATLVRGGSAIVNSARVVLSITAPPVTEAGAFVMLGLQPDRVRRLEHVKINDAPPAEPAYFVVTSEKVKVHDGSEHAVRAVEFIPTPAAGGNFTDADRNVVMKAVDDGVRDEQGARVPLSPGGGRENRRDAIRAIAEAIMNARSALTEPQAKHLARDILKDLRDRIGCVVEEDVQIPRYKQDGQRDGSRKARGLGCRWHLASWVSAASTATPLADGPPVKDDPKTAATEA